jgi:peptidoglycan/xylan/chitin deacetylase (PgdA/CDA1 family)
VKAAVRVPILYYHRVEDHLHPAVGVSPRVFAAQMEYLRKKNYWSISFEQLADYFLKGRPLPSRPVIISFDDGYLDNFTRAYPLLKKNGFRATIFMVSDYIGQRSEWEGCRGDDLAPMMSREQVLTLRRDGFEIGGHTRSHSDLTAIPPENARRDVEGGKKDLEELLQQPVGSFAYPFGNFNPEVVELVRDVGFTTARTVHTDNTHCREDLLTLRCVKLNGRTPWLKFRYYLTALYHWETRRHERRKFGRG